MNTKARKALVAAALSGRPQIRGAFHRRGLGLGDCAVGILHELDPLHDELWCCVSIPSVIGLSTATTTCPVEGCPYQDGETELVIHLNDTHLWDFLTIARKFPEEKDNVTP